MFNPVNPFVLLASFFIIHNVRATVTVSESSTPATTANIFLEVSTDVDISGWATPISASITCSPTCNTVPRDSTTATVSVQLRRLTGGTEYTITTAEVTGSGVGEIDNTYPGANTDKFCTPPGTALMVATPYETVDETIIIKASNPGSAITAYPNSDLDRYFKTSGPGTSPRTDKDEDMTIRGLPAGGHLHIFNFRALSICSTGNKQSADESIDYRVCTSPGKITVNASYESTTSTITILTATTPPTRSVSDSLDLVKFQLQRTYPVIALVEASTFEAIPVDDNMTFSNLKGGTEFPMKFRGIFTCTGVGGGEIESNEDSDEYVACTIPGTADLSAVSYDSDVDSITIITSVISNQIVTAGPNSEIYQYAKTSGPGTASDTPKDSGMTISGLAKGELHTFKFKAISKCTSGNKLSVEESEEFKACTKPGKVNVTAPYTSTARNITILSGTTPVTKSPDDNLPLLQYYIEGSPAADFDRDLDYSSQLIPGQEYFLTFKGLFRCDDGTDRVVSSADDSDVYTACTLPEKAVMGSVLYESDNASITIKAQDNPITADASSGIDQYKLESTGTATPGTAAATDKDQNMVISDLEAGTVYSLRFKAQISCADGPTPSIKESEDDSDPYTACTVPNKPLLTGIGYVSTGTNIIILASSANSVAVSAGGIDQYKMSSTSTGSTSSAYSNKDANMVITGLSPGSMYTLTFKSSIQCRGIPLDSSEDSENYTACTIPDTAVMGSVLYESDNESITIKAQDNPITADESSGIDQYKLESTGTATPGTATATDKDQNMVISDLEAGTVYSLRFRAQISCADGPTPSTKESRVDSEPYPACTVPNKPEMTGIPYGSTTERVTIQASSASSVTVSAGGIDQYKMSSNNTGSTSSAYSNKDARMVITGLTAGSMYIFTFKSSIQCGDIPLDSIEDSENYTACTLPGKAVMDSVTYSSDGNSITIEAQANPITIEDSSPIEQYKLVSTGTANPGTATATDKDQNMVISDLDPGTVYSLRFKGQISCVDGPIPSTKESEDDSEPYHACTVPNRPVMDGINYTSTASMVTIHAASSNPVNVSTGGIDQYKMSSSSTGSTATPYSDKDASMEITGLTGGTQYDLLFKSSINCSGTPVDSTQNSEIYTACTLPDKAVMGSVLYESDNESITIKAQDNPITADASSGIDQYKLESTGTATPGTATATDKDLNMVISDLEAGTVYSLRFKAQISCADGPTPSTKESEEDSDPYTACTVPNQPVLAGVTYVSTHESITIQASNSNPVTVPSGGIDQYKMSSSSTGSTATSYSDKDASMEITGLTGGTQYNLLFKSSIDCSGTPLDSTGDSNIYTACTLPGKADMGPVLYESDNESITIKAQDNPITADASSGIDQYKLESTGTATPGTATATDKDLNMVISDLEAGTVYSLRFKAQISCADGPTTSTKESGVDSEPYSACTAPNKPDVASLITTQDETTITIQGSTTEVAATAGALDKYYIVNLSPNDGSNIDKEAVKDADLILDGLTPGQEYTITLGTKIDGCGGRNSTESANITVCANPTQPVVTSIELADYNDTEITISWTQTDEYDKWALSISADGSTSQALEITKAENKLTHTFTTLTEGTVYSITMVTHSHGCTSTALVFTHKTKWNVDIQQNNHTIQIPETLHLSNGDVAIFEIHTDDVVNQSVYWVVAESPSGYFRVENATSSNWPVKLYLLQDVDLDYENKAGNLDGNPMNVVVKAGDIEPFIPDYFQLTVEILNVNDEGPQWVDLVTQADIDENSPAATVLFTLTATDLDDDDTISPLTFSLSGGDGNFELYSTTQGSGGITIATDYTSPNWNAEVRLSPAVSLDYETASLYNLLVTVSDGVNRDIFATLTVTVNDLIDIDPEIRNLQDATRTDPVTVEIAEMSATPLDIFLVEAINDEGEPIEFSILSVADSAGNPSHEDDFEIDSDTGQLSIAAGVNLDYESYVVPQHFVLIIQVTNTADSTKTATGTITVSIQNVPEAPVFDRISPQGKYFVLNEFETAYAVDTLVNTALLGSSNPSAIDLGTYDPDVPVGSTDATLTDSIEYTLLETANSEIFMLESSCVVQNLAGGGTQTADCNLVFNHSNTIDFENPGVAQQPYFDIIVRAKDSTGITNEMVLQFKLQNLNDEAPVFLKTPYKTAVAENSWRGSPIFVVQGEDPDFQDTDVTPDVTYSLPQDLNSHLDKQYFGIDSVTGVVSVLYPFNREVVGNWLNITVRITDTPTADHNTELSTDTILSIYISDETGETPQLKDTFLCSEVELNAPNGTVVDTFTTHELVTDSALTPARLIGFEVSTSNLHFEINETTGEVLRTRTHLQLNKVYILFARAFDYSTTINYSPLGYIRIDAYEEIQHCVNFTVEHVLDDVTITFQNDLVLALNGVYSKSHFWTFKVSTVQNSSDNHQSIITLYAMYNYTETCRAENLSGPKKFVPFKDLLAVLQKSAKHETPIDKLQTGEFAQFKIVRVWGGPPKTSTTGIGAVGVALIITFSAVVGVALLTIIVRAVYTLIFGAFSVAPKIFPASQSTITKVEPNLEPDNDQPLEKVQSRWKY